MKKNRRREAGPSDGRRAANPRETAFLILKETAAGRFPEESLADHGPLLSPRDLALTTALVYEVLRRQAFLDWLLQARLSAGRAGPDLTLVLRLGLAQILYFDRLGDHAIVAETVTLAQKIVPGRQGLVNAVLRGLLRERETGGPWPPEPPATLGIGESLALRHNCRLWLATDLLKRFGQAEAEKILAAYNRPTPPTLRINPRRAAREELALKLPFATTPTSLSPWGLRAENFAGRPETWPGYAEGLFAIQDEASQLVGLLTGDLGPGAEILDACAGLGGKALHLAALNPAARVTARDRNPARLERLAAEARRLGLNNVAGEARDLLEGAEAKLYDLVLMDAPCSGLGVMRRRPDLKWSKGPDDVARLAEIQLRLLSAGADLVRPGGRLLYGVCSFSPAEGPRVAAAFPAGRPEFRAAPPSVWPEALRPHLDPAGHLTLWPHRHLTDGFFWAVFERG